MASLLRALALALLLAAPAAWAARVSVPVDVGVGPSAFVFTGSLFADQPVFAGVKIDVQAVIDQQWLRQNARSVPRQYRGLSRNVEEVRISPSPLIPDSFFLSPKVRNTGVFGVTWRPLSVGTALGGRGARLGLGAGLLLTYAFLYSDTLPTTHFLRPGLDLRAELELAATKSFLVSLGWSSAFYVPQALGSFGFGPLQESIWHVGQAFLVFHFRFPYTVQG